ncbi:MAG: sigma 54-interacting transcriptional regulator [Deltaproteobacteria bacterium]|nr:sigma 54-interacting transcriptional regulator [Deltaproteobacteria bacterium]
MKLNKFYSAGTFFLSITAIVYGVVLHISIYRQPYAGFSLDTENTVLNVEPSIKSIHRGMKLEGIEKSGDYVKIRSTFHWMKILRKNGTGKVNLHFREKNKLFKIEHTIKRLPLWPKFGFSITAGLIVLAAAGFLIFRRKSEDINLFMLLTISATYVLILAFNNLDTVSPSPSLLLPFLGWNLLAPVALLLFFLRYPVIRKAGKLPLAGFIFIPSLFAFVITGFYYLKVYSTPDVSNQNTLLMLGRLLVPGTNLLYGTGTIFALGWSFFNTKAMDRRKVMMIIYGLFLMLLILTSWVFLYSRENAIAQLRGGPDLIFLLFSVMVVFLVMSTSRQLTVKIEGLFSRSLAYGIITIGIIVLYLILSISAGLVLTQFFGFTSRTVTIITAVVSTAGLFSFRDMVQHYIDRMFFRTRYRYSETISDIGEQISTVMEVPRLIGEILRIIIRSMDLSGAAALLPESHRGVFRLYKTEGLIDLPDDFHISRSTAASILRAAWNGTVFTMRSNTMKEIIKYDACGNGAVVLLSFQTEIVGIIVLPEKNEDSMYTRDDMELLNTIAKQSALALKNAVSFTTILRLNENLTRRKDEIEKLKSRLEIENTWLKKEVSAGFGEIIGSSEKMREIHQLVQKIAPMNTSTLILGESGTGKELIARTIHKLSNRNKKPLITVNCAAIPENLLESELFGHEKGAFTGAVRKKSGQMELADGGTIFLDEIGELPLSLQPKILRALQEGEINPLGSERTVKIDIRVITATNRNLEEMVKKGKFREDLYYRINVVPVILPPLRERATDILELASHFIEHHSRRMGKKITGMSKYASKRLFEYPWPGNVRELANVIERAVALSSSQLLDNEIMLPNIRELKTQESIPDNDSDNNPIASIDRFSELPYREAMDAFKREYIESMLRKVQGNRSEAARIIGLRRPYLHKLIKELGIEEAPDKTS